MGFVIQGISPAALGGVGGGLGYGPDTPGGPPGIPRSLIIKFDLFSNAGEGINSTGIFTNSRSPTIREFGLAPGFPDTSIDLTGTGIDLHSGDTFKVDLTYDGTTLTEKITDTVTGATFTTSYVVNIPGLVGSDVGYVGFTGGTGGLTAIQDILSWKFTTTLSDRGTGGSGGGVPPPPAPMPPGSDPGTGSSGDDPGSTDGSGGHRAGLVLGSPDSGTTPSSPDGANDRTSGLSGPNGLPKRPGRAPVTGDRQGALAGILDQLLRSPALLGGRTGETRATEWGSLSSSRVVNRLLDPAAHFTVEVRLGEMEGSGRSHHGTASRDALDDVFSQADLFDRL
jgi:hypothetical protein